MLVGLVKFAKVVKNSRHGGGGVKNPENKPSSFMDSPMSANRIDGYHRGLSTLTK